MCVEFMYTQDSQENCLASDCLIHKEIDIINW